MNKYPFIVTVFRLPGTRGPEIQQYNFEDVGLAHVKLGEAGNDRSVYRATLSVTLKEINYRRLVLTRS